MIGAVMCLLLVIAGVHAAEAAPIGPWLDARDAGIVCDGTTDNTAALSALIVTLAATPQHVVFPAGVCFFASPIVAALDKLDWQGADHLTIFRWRGTNGLTVNYGASVDAVPKITGIKFETLTAGVGTAITLTGPNDRSSNLQHNGPRLENIDIEGDDPLVHGWLHGVVLNYAWEPTLEHLTCTGQSGPTPVEPFSMRDCISYYQTISLSAHNFRCFNLGSCVIQSSSDDVGMGAGLDLSQFVMVAVSTGVYVTGSSGGTAITNGHINSFHYGVVVNNSHVRFIISHVMFYKIQLSADSYSGILANNVDDLIIDHNIFASPQAVLGAAWGMYLTDVTDSVIDGNIIDWASGIPGGAININGSGSTRDILTGNHKGPGVPGSTIVIAAGTGTPIWQIGNYP